MGRRIVIVACALTATPGLATAQVGIDRVAWMQGCWQFAAGDRVVEENWTTPKAGVMLGTGRTIRAGKLIEHEFVLLAERGGRLAYEAHPSGQAVATFTAGTVEGDSVVFEDPSHDFPQRVGYRRLGSGQLLAWIEGTASGQPRRVEFPYLRVECPR